MPNDKLVDLSFVDKFRDGFGFEIDTTTKDDYINLSGYELSDFTPY